MATGTLRLLDSNRGFELHIPELGPEAPCVPLDPTGTSLLCGTSEVRLLVRGEGPDLGAWCG